MLALKHSLVNLRELFMVPLGKSGGQVLVILQLSDHLKIAIEADPIFVRFSHCSVGVKDLI